VSAGPPALSLSTSVGSRETELVVHSTAALPKCLRLAGLLISPILGDYGEDIQRRMCHITLSAMDCSRGVG
jgi:hypothetical protein